jgi:NADPH2:quinone reductase
MMPRAWQLQDLSGYSSLRLDDVAQNEPADGEVRIRVQAFALNWGDMDLMQGNYTFSFPKLPACVGIEASGVIDAVGPGVTGHAVGDFVSTLPYFYYGRGASTESLIIDARFVVKAPQSLSAAEAASIWMQYLTAYYPIAEITPMGDGDFALVTAATSTAGAAMLEIGRTRGVTMIGTTRNPESAEYLREMGADHVIVTGRDDVAEELHRITGGRGVDLVFDCVAGELLTQYGSSLARNARIFFYGLLGGVSPELPLFEMLAKNAVFHPYSVFNYVEDADFLARGLAYVYAEIDAGRIRPRIDRVFAMEDYVRAWDYLSAPRQTHGKVVIETGLS